MDTFLRRLRAGRALTRRGFRRETETSTVTVTRSCAFAFMLLAAFLVWAGQTRALRMHFRETAPRDAHSVATKEAPPAAPAHGAAP